MYTIRKEFSFAASHKLIGLREDHPCSRTHGHNYVVTVELQSFELNHNDFVIDYRELQPIKEWIENNLDHQHLNDVKGISQPSAECIAEFLFNSFKERYPMLKAVEVSETPKTTARYEPNAKG